MIIGLQITGFIFALLMIYLSIVHYKKGSLNGMEIATWLVIWTLVILAVIFPEILRTYSQAFAVSRLLDLLIAGGFILVISMVAILYLKTKKIEKKLEDLIRRDALMKK
ncbi:hypothetical protein A2422_02460 [Candidatus Woesebacteria bacterium RIFOXYC1_FULL_31_51]|uniref:DUF2304 domain-containing protein n=1 Tax=Candidatus Woesebacteria bacterium GW2011_GWC2_31_9 TaxID=1618586 RepID=A0A0F9YHX3_9BACT|nr:MAG: hypothetical protein UR17_C0001G0951 [Candidatus Woesebacteria bacterium GW2011_GWF1_31_35]KKP23506.1 MAG: hypothetical protein UR11_C0001G0480 [Candidatus Woesebacteria bacterium GW2011_GWC1_30_29]KKP25684.1 MAG: hypothetical protein UR13_C0007G0005 [Candidatus Woesebacteria bacterium GW2011_GWD1_31_12]KKP27782.1 MAG: hypothetical protein UR16_C0002G0112 [Candidatus Woesebacteria bacterium GW2011_GWB1_31_29]KKP31104.1 MAG: hypothetical protein UR21_C0016G0022 [Candidatus Woesebacteria 